MATPYSIVYDRALAKLTDYDLAFMPDDDLQLMLRGWLKSAIAKFRKCASDLSDRDDELNTFNVDLVDEEIEILAMLVVAEWLEPQVNSVLLTHQMFGGKEEKFYAQANHLDQLRSLLADSENKVRSMLRDRGYIHNAYTGK